MVGGCLKGLKAVAVGISSKAKGKKAMEQGRKAGAWLEAGVQGAARRGVSLGESKRGQVGKEEERIREGEAN